MNPILEKIVRTGQCETADGHPVAAHSHVKAGEGQLLQSLVRELRPAVTLEIGLGFGVSALYICDALNGTGTRHIVIDPGQNQPLPGQPTDWLGMGLLNLRRAGFEPLIEFHGEPSFRVLPQLEREGRVIDFALIDGWTTFDYKLVDFFYIDRLLRVGGIVAVRPGGMPSGLRLCRYIATNLAYRVCGGAPTPPPDQELHLAENLVAFRKEQPDTRPWDFHRDF